MQAQLSSQSACQSCSTGSKPVVGIVVGRVVGRVVDKVEIACFSMSAAAHDGSMGEADARPGRAFGTKAKAHDGETRHPVSIVDSTVNRRLEVVIAPARKEVTNVDDESSRERGNSHPSHLSSCAVVTLILRQNLEPRDPVLRKECEAFVA